MKKITLTASSLLLSACSPSMPELPDVSEIITDLTKSMLYKDDVNQGSVLDRFSINQLKVGMSKDQVRNLIGSPSVVDPFHNNQWDYINHSTLYNKKNIRYRLTLTFKGDLLDDINQSGITSLPALNDKEQALETQRIAKEKAESEALGKLAIERDARKKAIAEEMAIVEAMVKAKAERIAQEKAAVDKITKEKTVTENPPTDKP